MSDRPESDKDDDPISWAEIITGAGIPGYTEPSAMAQRLLDGLEIDLNDQTKCEPSSSTLKRIFLDF